MINIGILELSGFYHFKAGLNSWELKERVKL
jgi:hypothetical protein